MKLIVAGTRTINIDAITVLGLIKAMGLDIESTEGHEIVSGGCPTGPDLAAKAVPAYVGVNYKEFLPDWENYGKSAGPIRNKKMAEYADALILIWDGKSRGSTSMYMEMQKLNKPIYEVIMRSGL